MPLTVAPRVALSPRATRWPVGVAALVWLGVGVSASYWALTLWQGVATVAVPTLATARPAIEVSQVARALGAGATAARATAEAPESTRLSLLGVVRDARGLGAALIADAGQPAKPYRVGAELPGGWVLKSLDAREAVLTSSDGVRRLTLQLPAPQAGRVASLPGPQRGDLTAPMAPLPATPMSQPATEPGSGA